MTRSANPLLGQCRKWFRDARKILDKSSVVKSKAEKGAHIADALGHWPVLYIVNFLVLGVNSLYGDHMPEKGNAFFK